MPTIGCEVGFGYNREEVKEERAVEKEIDTFEKKEDKLDEEIKEVDDLSQKEFERWSLAKL